MRGQMGKPIPSPVVLGQITERFREAVKSLAQRQQIPVHEFTHKEKKDDIANQYRRERGTRDGIVFIGVAQEKAKTFQGKKVNGQFQFERDRTVYVNHYYFYIDDEDFGPLSSRCAAMHPGESSSAATDTNGPSVNWNAKALPTRRWTTDFYLAPTP